jgi:CheY-like chemotaxis protein
MDHLAPLEECLSEALANLYNPTFQPAPDLRPLLQLQTNASLDATRLALIDAVEMLKPAGGAPDSSDAARLYAVLRCRYIEGLTQREAAERLNFSERHLRREQQRAVEVLRQGLQQRLQQQSLLAAATKPAAPATTADGDRIVEIRRELQALVQSAPGELSDVGAVIRSAVKVSAVSGMAGGITLRSGAAPANLLSTIHRAVLREVIITAIERMAPAIAPGVDAPGLPTTGLPHDRSITVSAERQGRHAVITITGSPSVPGLLPEAGLFVKEAIAAAGGTLTLASVRDGLAFTISLPTASQRRVLVLEDNEDLVHLYRRYTTDTRYEIVPVAADADILQVAGEIKPDVILMDILLPNIDGWELLNQLHEHPGTRGIPIIICSVVRREELSLALGATLYLQKPVTLHRFIQALDQVLQETAGAVPPAGTRSAAVPPG